MSNHVLRDDVWDSKKLERCSDGAAAWYPWIYLVCDDHGRFEYHPRAIWACVFRRRPAVTLENVQTWLSEYEREGLLVRYDIDGELAVWTGFKGRRPSERRESDYPDPEQFPEVKAEIDYIKKHGRPRDKAAPKPRRERGKTATQPRQSRASSDHIGSDQIVSEGRQAAIAAPSWIEVAGQLYEQQFGIGAWTKARAIRFNGAAKKAVDAYGEARVLAVWGWFIAQPEKPAFITPEQFVGGFLEHERRMLGGPIRAPTGKALERKEQIEAGIVGGLKRHDRWGMDSGNGGPGDAARPRLAAGGSGPAVEDPTGEAEPPER